MNINREDLKKQYFKVINNIEYQPSFNYTKFENDKYIGLEITKTAEEVYIDSLKPNNIKDNTTEDYLLDLDYRVSKIELGLEGK